MREQIAAALADGYTWFDVMTAYDDFGRSDEIIVVVRLRNSQGEAVMIEQGVHREDATLPDVSDLIAGAAWGQRYVHDFYGVTFVGADARPLLNHAQGVPLRKDVTLAAHEGASTGRRRRRR